MACNKTHQSRNQRGEPLAGLRSVVSTASVPDSSRAADGQDDIPSHRRS
jgi:hypothetical protein